MKRKNKKSQVYREERKGRKSKEKKRNVAGPMPEVASMSRCKSVGSRATSGMQFHARSNAWS